MCGKGDSIGGLTILLIAVSYQPEFGERRTENRRSLSAHPRTTFGSSTPPKFEVPRSHTLRPRGSPSMRVVDTGTEQSYTLSGCVSSGSVRGVRSSDVAGEVIGLLEEGSQRHHQAPELTGELGNDLLAPWRQ